MFAHALPLELAMTLVLLPAEIDEGPKIDSAKSFIFSSNSLMANSGSIIVEAKAGLVDRLGILASNFQNPKGKIQRFPQCPFKFHLQCG